MRKLSLNNQLPKKAKVRFLSFSYILLCFLFNITWAPFNYSFYLLLPVKQEVNIFSRSKNMFLPPLCSSQIYIWCQWWSSHPKWLKINPKSLNHPWKKFRLCLVTSSQRALSLLLFKWKEEEEVAAVVDIEFQQDQGLDVQTQVMADGGVEEDSQVARDRRKQFQRHKSLCPY